MNQMYLQGQMLNTPLLVQVMKGIKFNTEITFKVKIFDFPSFCCSNENQFLGLYTVGHCPPLLDKNLFQPKMSPLLSFSVM